MMRVSHDPPSFLPPRVLVLIPALARALRAFGILGADAEHHPFSLCSEGREGAGNLAGSGPSPRAIL